MTKIYNILRSAKRSVFCLFSLPAEIKEFGWKFAFFHIGYAIILQWTDNPKIYNRKHKLVLEYLQSDLSQLITEIRESKLKYNEEPIKKIWVFWYQGLSNAPDIVQKCRILLRQNYQDYEIIELDGHNYKDYCHLPDFIVEKTKQGLISITEFSDILRSKLLYEYGGMWVDSTLLTIGQMDEALLNLPFFTIRNNGEAPACVSGLRLSTYYQYYKKNNNYVGFLYQLFLEYWNHHKLLVEYLLMDYFLILLANNNDQFRKLLDEVPFTNPNVHTIRNHINDEYLDNNWKKITENTNLFKMTYKILMTKYSKNGNITNYGHIMDNL